MRTSPPGQAEGCPRPALVGSSVLVLRVPDPDGIDHQSLSGGKDAGGCRSTANVLAVSCALALEWPPVLASLLHHPGCVARRSLSVYAPRASQRPAGLSAGGAVCRYRSASPMGL